MTDQKLMIGLRVAAWSLMMAKAAFMGHLFLHVNTAVPLRSQIAWLAPHMRTIFVGMVLIPAGWSLHQLYWWVADSADAPIRQAMYGNPIYTAGFYGLIFIGVGLMFSGWLHSIFGSAWPLIAVATVLSLVAIGALNAG